MAESGFPFRWIKWIVTLLVLKVTTFIVIGYRNYFPPDFNSDFLWGRESTFFGRYQWFFYPHLMAGPIAILLGLLLVNQRFLRRFPDWHRRLGRIQVVNVLGVLAPSGLGMAFYAAAGPIAGGSLGCLALLTGWSMLMGWRRAVQRKFVAHRRWMLRNLTLLCSAIVLRLVAGTATVFEFGPVWFDPVASWGCWLVPLLLLELSFQRFPMSSPRLGMNADQQRSSNSCSLSSRLRTTCNGRADSGASSRGLLHSRR